MGDHGKLYVPEELVPIYREQIIPLADIITPNQFEAELLAGCPITDQSSALVAIGRLHDCGIPTVILSSTDIDFRGNKNANNDLVAIASHQTSSNSRQVFAISIPRLDATFIGTGDLFAALFLAWYTKTDNNLKQTLENVIASLQAVMRRTQQYAEYQPNSLNSWANFELKLIQSRHDLLEPTVKIEAEEIIV